MSDVLWRPAAKGDQSLLRAFTCCPAAEHPQRRPCDCPWAHEVQTYFRSDAITSCNRHQLTHDQRLLLVLDGPVLIGAAVHALTDDDDPEGVRDRALVAYAVDVAYHGKDLSDGRRASSVVLEAVVADVCSRHDQEQVVLIHALVDPANVTSSVCLSRFGIAPRGRDSSGDYILHSARLN